MRPILYGYQRRWFDDRSRFKLGKFARQTGKTFTTTLETVDDSFEHVVRQARTRWVILSRGERQAREAMDEGVKLHARAYGMTFQEYEQDYDIGAVRYTALEVALPHGSRILALPANPDTARGFSANVFLDEFAFHKDSTAIWKALFPVISAGNCALPRRPTASRASSTSSTPVPTLPGHAMPSTSTRRWPTGCRATSRNCAPASLTRMPGRRNTSSNISTRRRAGCPTN